MSISKLCPAPKIITHEFIRDINIWHRGRECVERKNDSEQEGEGNSHERQLKGNTTEEVYSKERTKKKGGDQPEE
jgi:hypothetical protein